MTLQLAVRFFSSRVTVTVAEPAASGTSVPSCSTFSTVSSELIKEGVPSQFFKVTFSLSVAPTFSESSCLSRVILGVVSGTILNT